MRATEGKPVGCVHLTGLERVTLAWGLLRRGTQLAQGQACLPACLLPEEGTGLTCLAHVGLLRPRAAGVRTGALRGTVGVDVATHLNAPFLLFRRLALPRAVSAARTLRQGRMQDLRAEEGPRPMQLAEVAKDNNGVHRGLLKTKRVTSHDADAVPGVPTLFQLASQDHRWGGEEVSVKNATHTLFGVKTLNEDTKPCALVFKDRAATPVILT